MYGAGKVKWKSWIKSWVIHFTLHTINCVCHSIRSMFILLGMYNFDENWKPKNGNMALSSFHFQEAFLNSFFRMFQQTKIWFLKDVILWWYFPYLPPLDVWNSLFNELEFFPVWTGYFACCACKIWNKLKIKFTKLNT